jgi:hypothetical protein
MPDSGLPIEEVRSGDVPFLLGPRLPAERTARTSPEEVCAVVMATSRTSRRKTRNSQTAARAGEACSATALPLARRRRGRAGAAPPPKHGTTRAAGSPITGAGGSSFFPFRSVLAEAKPFRP